MYLKKPIFCKITHQILRVYGENRKNISGISPGDTVLIPPRELQKRERENYNMADKLLLNENDRSQKNKKTTTKRN